MEEVKMVQDGVEVASIDVTEIKKVDLTPVETDKVGGISKAVIALAAAGVIAIGVLVAKKRNEKKRRNEEEAEIKDKDEEYFREVDDPDEEAESVEGTVEPGK